MLRDVGFRDTWLETRLDSGESSSALASQQDPTDLYEGEQGATFYPPANGLASGLTGSGFDSRPQRYDRILISGNVSLQPRAFNLFGQTMSDTESASQEILPGSANDHWGIRCLVSRKSLNDTAASSVQSQKGLDLHKAPLSLGDFDKLKQILASYGGLPTENDNVLAEKPLGSGEARSLKPIGLSPRSSRSRHS